MCVALLLLTVEATTPVSISSRADWPTNDTSCHTGRGIIYGMHFQGLEIESVPAKDYGECCAACGAQQTSPKPGQQKCTWIEWNPNVPQPQCTLKTGEGNVAGQHNGIMSGAHGSGASTPTYYACSTTNYSCSPVAAGTRPSENLTKAACTKGCVAPRTTYACDVSSGSAVCSIAKPGHSTNMSKGQCQAKCVAPPPPPIGTNPCLRFGHTVPVEAHVDVEIRQSVNGKVISHSWSNYKFGDFSDWVNVFKPGVGAITFWENIDGKRAPTQLYSLSGIPLTPGPLMVVLKVDQALFAANSSALWPPRSHAAVETIASSYIEDVPKVRLFNLSPDTKLAGMASGGKVLARNVAYSLGSPWHTIQNASLRYSFTDDLTKKELLSRTELPPPRGLGATNILLGLQASANTFDVNVVPLVDAPEGGVCKP